MGLKNVVLDKKGPVNAKQKSERLLKMGGGKDQTSDLKQAFGLKNEKKPAVAYQPTTANAPKESIITKIVTTRILD